MAGYCTCGAPGLAGGDDGAAGGGVYDGAGGAASLGAGPNHPPASADPLPEAGKSENAEYPADGWFDPLPADAPPSGVRVGRSGGAWPGSGLSGTRPRATRASP